MGLPLKFNLVLVLVILAGFAATGLVSRQLLQDNAREEVLRNARLLMDRQRPAGAPPGQPDGLAWQPSTSSTPPAGRAQTPASPSVRAARRYRPLLLPLLQRRAACAAAAGLEPVHRPAGEMIVKKEVARHTALETLLQALATEIDRPADRASFLAAMQKL